MLTAALSCRPHVFEIPLGKANEQKSIPNNKSTKVSSGQSCFLPIYPPTKIHITTRCHRTGSFIFSPLPRPNVSLFSRVSSRTQRRSSPSSTAPPSTAPWRAARRLLPRSRNAATTPARRPNATAQLSLLHRAMASCTPTSASTPERRHELASPRPTPSPRRNSLPPPPRHRPLPPPRHAATS